MPDSRVQAAISNWAPRFTSQGVDYNDFVRTTGKIERWEEWLDAWCETGDMHAELASSAEAEGNRLTAGEAYVRAALCYHFAKFVWMLDMDKYRAAADRAVSSLYKAHGLLDETAERVEAGGESPPTPLDKGGEEGGLEKGGEEGGPASESPPAPLDKGGEEGGLDKGRAEAPPALESPPAPLDKGGEEGGLDKGRAESPPAPLVKGGEEVWVVGNLRRPPGVERAPLVLLLPGLDSTKEEFFHWENVFLKRGMATLSLEGPGQGETGYTSHIRPDYEVAVRAMLAALDGRQDIDLERVGIVGVSLGGYYAPRVAAFEPRLRAAAAIGGPYDFGECWPSLPAITRETFVYHSGAKDEEEAQEKAAQLNLRDVAARVEQPMLVVFGKLDRLIPWQQAERLAAEAPNARLVMYADGNHVCNNIPYKYRPLVADWMSRTLQEAGHA